MATFGRDFVRAATQPAYLQGLFTAAQQVGSAPARRRQMGMLRDMTPVEQADYFASIATTPDEMLRAQQLKTNAITQAREDEKQGALTSLRSLEAARQAEEDPEAKRRIEAIMSRVAPQAGVDPITISGRTQQEEDKEIERELRQNRVEDERRTKQEAAISEAYYAVPEQSREQFERNVERSGFGSVIDELKEDRQRDQLVKLQLENAKTEAAENAAMRKAPLPTSSLKTRIEEANIDPQLKEQFLSELNDISEPDFESGETWQPGARKLALNALESLNSSVRSEVSREVTRKNSIRTDIRRLESQLTKPPTEEQIKEQLPRAKEELSTVSRVAGFEFVSEETDEDVIRQKAIEIARLERDNQINELIKQRRAELGESLVVEEAEEEDAATDQENMFKEADSIVGG